MNDPYGFAPRFDDLAVAAWARYEDEADVAHQDYLRAPARRPWVKDHHSCLCCDVLTVQDSTICLSCQKRSPAWRHLPTRHPLFFRRLRAANCSKPAELRRALA